MLLIYGRLAYGDLDMNQLDRGQINGANRDFSALVAHTVVAPASGLLRKGGFELGVIAGTSSIPNIERAIAARDPSASTESRLPNAGLIGLYAFAKSLTLELKIIPEISSSTLYMGSQSVALKFSFHDWFDDPSWVTGLRLQLTNAYIYNDQQVTNPITGGQVDGRTKFASLSYGLVGLLGYRKILEDTFLLEPYTGVGVIRAESKYEIMADVPTTMFASGSSSESSSQNGIVFLLGVQAHMFYSKVGLEYSRIFDSDKTTLKISFGY